MREIRKRVYMDGCSSPYVKDDDPSFVWREADPPCPVCQAVERGIAEALAEAMARERERWPEELKAAGLHVDSEVRWFEEARRAHAEAASLRARLDAAEAEARALREAATDAHLSAQASERLRQDANERLVRANVAYNAARERYEAAEARLAEVERADGAVRARYYDRNKWESDDE